MKKVSLYRFVLALAALLCLGSAAQAQFAGPDKELVRLDDNSQTTTVGTPNSDSRVCYTWTGPYIVDGVHSAEATVNPHDSISIYNVKRVSEYGVEEDQVIVRLYNEVEIIHVIPLKHCWKGGDEISVDDFVFETRPANCEMKVEPMRMPYPSNDLADDYEVELTFTATDPQSHKSDDEDIEFTVIDVNHKRTECVNHKLQIIDNWLRSLAAASPLCEAVGNFGRKISPVMKGPCAFTTDCGIETSTTAYPDCCGDRESDKLETTVTASASVGIEATIPFASAGVFTASAVLSASVGLGASLARVLTCDAEDFCISLQGTASVGGGIQAALICESVLAVSGMLVGSASLTGTLCLEQGFQAPTAELAVDAVMTLKALSLYEEKQTFRLATLPLF